jgi:hypothetical protein
MKPWAAAVIAGLPTEGAPSLIVSDPFSAKNAPTLAAFWLHHAAVYFAPNSFNVAVSIAVSLELQAESAADNNAAMPTTVPERSVFAPCQLSESERGAA